MATDERPGPGNAGEEAGLDRVLTLPNGVTLVRLLCIPLFVWLLFGAHRQSAAAVLLAVLGATDWVDGFLARRLHQVSTLGKVLDPAADRILVATAVISIMVYGAVPLWFGIATLAREVVVAGTVLALAALGARRIDVLWIGKAGTFALMFAYPAFLLGDGPATWQLAVRVVAWGTGGVGLVLAWAAAVMYLVPARRALAEGRAGRRGQQTGGTPATAPGHAMAPGAGEVGR
ncbi:MAG: CDP-alcohol phosphatidyltransferase family protein [Acidimicrobiales bacterium]